MDKFTPPFCFHDKFLFLSSVFSFCHRWSILMIFEICYWLMDTRAVAIIVKWEAGLFFWYVGHLHEVFSIRSSVILSLNSYWLSHHWPRIYCLFYTCCIFYFLPTRILWELSTVGKSHTRHRSSPCSIPTTVQISIKKYLWLRLTAVVE